MFTLITNDKNSRARVGLLKTRHGEIETPAYVIVATKGIVKTLTNEDVYRTGTQVLIANTFHLWREKLDEIETAGGVHEKFGWENMPLMTDSGGFQVFSYGFGREHGISKVGILPKDIRFRRQRERGFKQEKNAVTITSAGVRFLDGTVKLFLSPQKSIAIQEKIGADIIFAFDECTSPFHNYEYNKIALARTNAWAKICLESKTRNDQMLYGIVQGSVYKDLREESAKYIDSLPFDGFGIGGSFGETEMANVLNWTIPLLDEQKPRHLLGIGEIRDVLEGIERGIDTFDCVIPTREARHGSIWTRAGRYDVRNTQNALITEPLEKNCECDACAEVKRSALREMFKSGDKNAGRLATIHNIFFFNRLMSDARLAIKENRFDKFKNEVLGKLLLKNKGQ